MEQEERLIFELKLGSKEAFDKIYHIYFDRLYSFAYRYTKSRDLTENILQEVFIKLWRVRESIKQETSLQPLLYIITKNQVINAYRTNVRSAVYEEYLDYRDSFSADNTYCQLEYDDFVAILNREMSNLPHSQQKVVRLSKIEQLSNKEIAERLKISEQTVKNQLSMGLKMLRTLLKGKIAIIALIAAEIQRLI